MFSTVDEMAQNPEINQQLHIKSNEEGDGYLYKRHKFHLIEKQQTTQSQGHDHLHNIEGQVTVAELDRAGKMVAIVVNFSAL